MNRINKFMWAGALALGLAGFANSASAGVDVYVGVGTPGAVYYDDPRPVYRDHYYYSAPRPVYHYYDRRPAHRHYDRRPVYNNYYYHRDNGHHRHHRGHHHHHDDHGHRGNDRRWRDDHDRRYGRR